MSSSDPYQSDIPASAPVLPGDLTVRLLAQLPDAVIYSDPVGVIRLWNRAAEALFGFTEDEAAGKSLDIIIPERLREAHWRGFNAACRSGTLRLNGKPTLTRALHKSGASRFVEMSFALILGETATVLGSVAVARDVTERVEREKAARS